MPTRRTFLFTGAAGLTVIAASGAHILLKDPVSARAPWGQAGVAYDDPRLHALSYAILAPNPHNRQPWLIRLESNASLSLYCDLDRRLPQTDPLDRQITIGLGAFLELMTLTANASGYRLKTDLFPDGEPQSRLDEQAVAHVTFIKDETVTADPLFSAVLSRRTHRVPFTPDPVPAAMLSTLSDQALLTNTGRLDGSSDPDRVQELKDIAKAGWAIESTLPRTHYESLALTRIGAKAVSENPDGISIYGPLIEGLKTAGIMTSETIADPDSRASRLSYEFYENLIETTSSFVWLTSPSNDRVDQIQAGADWLRFHLAATLNNIAIHPLSQVLQEFPEMANLYKQIHDRLGITRPAIIQGLFRVGYATAPKPSPRWPLETRLLPPS